MADQSAGAQGMVRQMLGMELYVIITKPVVPPEKVATKIQDHLKRQVELEKSGIMFGAGPMFENGAESPYAGMIIVRANSFEEADEIAKGGPLHAAGFREYTISKWKMNEGGMNFTVNYSDQSVTIG